MEQRKKRDQPNNRRRKRGWGKKGWLEDGDSDGREVQEDVWSSALWKPSAMATRQQWLLVTMCVTRSHADALHAHALWEHAHACVCKKPRWTGTSTHTLLTCVKTYTHTHTHRHTHRYVLNILNIEKTPHSLSCCKSSQLVHLFANSLTDWEHCHQGTNEGIDLVWCWG